MKYLTFVHDRYEEPEVALIYFVQNYDGKRDILKTYLVLTLSKSDNPDGGGCRVYVDSPSLGGKGMWLFEHM